jgi:hypothetical protein
MTPWEHNVPLDAELRNLSQTMEWIQGNPKEVREIAKRGRQFHLSIICRLPKTKSTYVNWCVDWHCVCKISDELSMHTYLESASTVVGCTHSNIMSALPMPWDTLRTAKLN